jgi:hypothetical protein
VRDSPPFLLKTKGGERRRKNKSLDYDKSRELISRGRYDKSRELISRGRYDKSRGS